MSPLIEVTFHGPIANIALRRPDKLNALDRDMIDALAEAARAIVRQPRVFLIANR